MHCPHKHGFEDGCYRNMYSELAMLSEYIKIYFKNNNYTEIKLSAGSIVLISFNSGPMAHRRNVVSFEFTDISFL